MPLFKICAHEPSSLPALLLAFAAIFQRTTAQMVFHIFAEKAGVGEAQTMAYLLHTKVGCAQIIGDGRQGVLLYPRIGRASRVLFADDGEVFRRDTQLRRIVIHRLMLCLGGLQQF